MTVKELKKIIAEEYRYWMAEQEPPMAMQGMPKIEVGPNDVDVDGMDEDPEQTLKSIYDMLKDYFEGESGMDNKAAPTPSDNTDDDTSDDDAPDMDDEEDEEDEDDKGKMNENFKRVKRDLVKERFQKLANILK
tara:strand:+ start:661 stop:1062 length:402 start_codon:yes stop_codon:yes gene_type:complete